MSGLAPLNALRAFEATARRGSFKAAAEELNVTAAAVGQQVRHLEALVGADLFERDGRRLVLSERGAAALAPLKRGFELMGEAGAALRATEPSRSVSISAPIDLMTLWLAPDFKAWPGAMTCVGPDETADLSLVLREPASAPKGAIRLMDEVLTPLAHPDLIASMTDMGLERLESLALIEDISLPDGWRAWLASRGGYGADRGAQFRVGSSLAALEMARSGAGVVLARKPLAYDLIRSGALLPVFPDGDWARPRSYYLISDTTPSVGVDRVIAHLQSAAAARQDLVGEL